MRYTPSKQIFFGSHFMKSKMKFIVAVIFLFSFLLLGLSIKTAFPLFNSRSGEPNWLENEPNFSSVAVVSSQEVPSTMSKRTRESPANAKDVMQKISACSTVAVNILRDDEFSRSKLISQSETDNTYNFQFEIYRNPDIENLLKETCRNICESEGINYAALMRLIVMETSDLIIPEGCTQKVFIEISKDPAVVGSYQMVTSDENDPPGKTTSVRGSITSGNASPALSNWLYRRFLDMTSLH